MENLQIKKSEAIRSIFRKCFIIEIHFFLLSLIPFEIWKHIMNISDIKGIVFLSQTCWAFNRTFEYLQENDVSIATRFRRKDQIQLGK